MTIERHATGAGGAPAKCVFATAAAAAAIPALARRRRASHQPAWTRA